MKSEAKFTEQDVMDRIRTEMDLRYRRVKRRAMEDARDMVVAQIDQHGANGDLLEIDVDKVAQAAVEALSRRLLESSCSA